MNCCGELGFRDIKCAADLGRFAKRKIGSHLDQIQTTIAACEFFVRQIVINIGEMDVEDFVTNESERLARIERVENDEAAEIHVVSQRRARAIECSERIVAEKEFDARIELGAALGIEGFETIEPDS